MNTEQDIRSLGRQQSWSPNSFGQDVESSNIRDSSLKTSSVNLPLSTNSKQVSPPEPSNGIKALQVIASFIPYMSSWGLLNSFGVFQAYYSQTLPKSQSQIAWIGSLQAFLLMFIAVLVGPAIDAGYLRHVLVIGGFLSGFGMIILGWCDQYYQLVLVQGIMIGIGAGCSFLPSISIIPQWFSPKSRTLALGIAATGSSVGAIIFPIMFHYIQASSGFGWAVRAIGFFLLGTNLISVLTLRYRTLPPSKRSLIDLSMFKEPPYQALCLAFFFAFIGLYIPIFFVQSYASAEGTTGSIIFWLVAILNAGSGFGRILPNIAAGEIGNLNTFIFVISICALLSLCWIAVHSTGAIIVFSLLYGFTSGGFVSLAPPVIVSTAPNMNNVATRIGMALSCCSIGVLIGNPVAGAILNSSHSYTGMQIFAGIMMFVSAILLIVQRWLKMGKVLKVKI